jgi:hypothetical protein
MRINGQRKDIARSSSRRRSERADAGAPVVVSLLGAVLESPLGHNGRERLEAERCYARQPSTSSDISPRPAEGEPKHVAPAAIWPSTTDLQQVYGALLVDTAAAF